MDKPIDQQFRLALDVTIEDATGGYGGRVRLSENYDLGMLDFMQMTAILGELYTKIGEIRDARS